MSFMFVSVCRFICFLWKSVVDVFLLHVTLGAPDIAATADSARCSSADVQLSNPLCYSLVTERELFQALHHAESLASEVLDGGFDEVEVIVEEPWAAEILLPWRRGVHGDGAALPFTVLALDHVDNRVDRAESAGASTSSAAMHKDGPDVVIFLRAQGFGRFGWRARSSLDLVTQIDEGKYLSGTGRSTEIGPGCVLDLGDFADRRERMIRVGEGERPDCCDLLVRYRRDGRVLGAGSGASPSKISPLTLLAKLGWDERHLLL